MNFWPKFCLAVLATWRLTHLLAHEDGPWDLIARLRQVLGSSWLGELMDCFYCLSLWIAVPAALFVHGSWIEIVFIWLAVSGGACILERTGQPPRWLPPRSESSPETVEIRAENDSLEG